MVALFLRTVFPLYIVSCVYTLPEDSYITYIRHYDVSTSPQDIHPPCTTLIVPTPHVDVVLNLTKNTRINVHAPVYILEGDTMRRVSVDNQVFALYTNSKHSAAISIVYDRSSDRKTFTGSFHVGTDEYTLQPATREHMRTKRSKIPQHLFAKAHVITKRTLQSAGLVSGASSRSQRNGTAAVQQTDKRTYGIELLMVIDHAIYYRWYTESEETSAVNKQTDAVAKIKYYFSHLTNGIDLRYMNIEESDFSFYVRLSGIIISTTLSTSPWAKSSDGKKTSSARRVLLNADVALSKFKEWLNKKQFNLSRHDHAMLFTGYDLWRGYTSTGAYDARVKGLATLSGICTSDKVSLVEDTGGFRSIITAAHELGHSLGARHDGNGNSCSTSSSYIMAALIGLATEDNHLNAFTFSPCSISAFRSHLATLNRGSNCLLNVAEHDDEATHQQHLRQLPGQLYPPHEQCRQIYGSKSYYCGGFTHDIKICQELYCYDTNRKVCFKENDMRGARGTTCGNHKWCIQGVCTYNASAPAAPEVCVHGDHTSTLPDGKTCKKMGQAYPHYCYIATIRDHCCATCGALHNASNPGCEYGDRHNVCKTLPRWRCYSYQEYCCQSCSEKSTGVKGCEYGDRMANCMTSHCSLPNARDQCCHTCGAEENTTATTMVKRNAVFTTSTKASKKAVTTSITTYIIKQSSTTKMPAFSSIRHTVSKISTKYLKKTSVTNKPRALSSVSYPIFKRTTTIAGTSNFERTAHNKPANTTKSDFSSSKHAVRTTELSIHTFSVANQTATSGICMAAFTLSVWHWYLNY